MLLTAISGNKYHIEEEQEQEQEEEEEEERYKVCSSTVPNPNSFTTHLALREGGGGGLTLGNPSPQEMQPLRECASI